MAPLRSTSFLIATVLACAPQSSDVPKEDDHASTGIAHTGEDDTGEDPTGSTAGEGVQRRELTVEPGDFVELNLHMDEAASLAVTFFASDGLAWDIHSHSPIGAVTIHQEGRGSDEDIRFLAPREGLFSVMWVNDAQHPVEMEVHLEPAADVEVDSWVPPIE